MPAPTIPAARARQVRSSKRPPTPHRTRTNSFSHTGQSDPIPSDKMLIATKLFQVVPPRPSPVVLECHVYKKTETEGQGGAFRQAALRSGHMLQLLAPSWRGRPHQPAAFGCARQIFRCFLYFRISVRDGRAATARITMRSFLYVPVEEFRVRVEILRANFLTGICDSES